jgi:hypothetical protein
VQFGVRDAGDDAGKGEQEPGLRVAAHLAVDVHLGVAHPDGLMGPPAGEGLKPGGHLRADDVLTRGLGS